MKVMDPNTSQDYKITPYQSDVTSHLLTVLMGIGEVMIYSELDKVDEKRFPVFYLLPVNSFITFKIACTENAFELLEENQMNDYIEKCKETFVNNLKWGTHQK
jgi:hypothetical protein